MQVHVSKDDSIEVCIKRFRKKVQKAGILSDYKRKKYFESPSEKRRRKESQAERRRNKRKRHKKY